MVVDGWRNTNHSALRAPLLKKGEESVRLATKVLLLFQEEMPEAEVVNYPERVLCVRVSAPCNPERVPNPFGVAWVPVHEKENPFGVLGKFNLPRKPLYLNR